MTPENGCTLNCVVYVLFYGVYCFMVVLLAIIGSVVTHSEPLLGEGEQ